MKKYLILFLLCSSVTGYSQGDIVPFTMGPVIGINSSTIQTDVDYNQQIPGTGFSGGLFFRIKLLKLYIQPEFMYSTRACILTGGDSTQSYNIKFESAGIDANALVGIKLFGMGSLANMRIFAGPGLANLSEKNFEYNGKAFPDVELSNASMSAILGIGVDVIKLTVDLRYSFGLNNISGISTKIKPNGLLLSLGVKLF